MADPKWAEFEQINAKTLVRPRDDFVFRFGQDFEAGMRSKVGDIVYNPADGLVYRCIKETDSVAPDYTDSIANTYWTWVAGAPQDIWHEVGAAGEPAFQNGWVNLGTDVDGEHKAACFRKSADGTVHSDGTIKSGTSGVIYTLPEGYRPDKVIIRAVKSYSTSLVLGQVCIKPDGSVLKKSGGNVSFNLGFSFYVGW